MDEILYFDEVQVRLPDLRVWCGDREVYLSMREMRMLMILMSSPYECFTHRELVRRMDLTGADVLPQVALILRRKLGRRYIVNYRGAGYAFINRRV